MPKLFGDIWYVLICCNVEQQRNCMRTKFSKKKYIQQHQGKTTIWEGSFGTTTVTACCTWKRTGLNVHPQLMGPPDMFSTLTRIRFQRKRLEWPSLNNSSCGIPDGISFWCNMFTYSHLNKNSTRHINFVELLRLNKISGQLQDTYHVIGVIFFVLNFQLIMAGRWKPQLRFWIGVFEHVLFLLSLLLSWKFVINHFFVASSLYIIVVFGNLPISSPFFRSWSARPFTARIHHGRPGRIGGIGR